MNYEEKLKLKSLDEYRRLHDDRIKKLEEYYIKDTELFKSLKDVIELHQNRTKELEISVGVLIERIVDLEVTSEHYSQRLHQLEEKERARARDEHERDVS